MDLTRLKEIHAQNEAKALEEKRFTENQVSVIQTQEVIARSFKMLVEFLDNKVTKTEVVNQLREIGTPDVEKVVTAVEGLHETLKTHENTDLTEVTAVLRGVLEQVSQLPKQLPEIPENKQIDYSKQFKSLEDAVKSIEKVVKAQKLVAEAPIVNVPEAKVDVEAPDLDPLLKEAQKSRQEFVKAVKSIVFPEFDTKPLEKKLDKLVKLFNEFLDTPIGGGGGGGGIASYKNSAGTVDQVQLDSQGRVPISQGATTGYSISNSEDTGTYKYYGFEDKDGRWYLMRKTIADNSYLYAAGTSGYSTAWTNRATQTYASYSTTFN